MSLTAVRQGRGKCAVSRDLCSLVTVKYYVHDASTQIGPHLLWPKRERPYPPRPSTVHGGKSLRNIDWGGRLCVEGWAFKKRLSKFRFRLFYVRKYEFSAKMFEIRMLAYGRLTNVTILFGCCSRRATRLRKAERTGYLVSNEATRRDERYSGGGGTQAVSTKTILFAQQH